MLCIWLTPTTHLTYSLLSRWWQQVILNLSAMQLHRAPVIHNARKGNPITLNDKEYFQQQLPSTTYSLCGLSLDILLPATHAPNILSTCREAVTPFNPGGNRAFRPKEWVGSFTLICHLQRISGGLDFHSFPNSFALYSYIPCFPVLTHAFCGI